MTLPYVSYHFLSIRRKNHDRIFDYQAAEVSAATQLSAGALFPIVQPANEDVSRPIGDAPKVHAYAALRKARSDKRLKGIREQRAKEKAAEEKDSKK